MPLKDIFTRLSLLKKNQTNPEELTDITQLLDERRLETSDPIIITVLGTRYFIGQFNETDRRDEILFSVFHGNVRKNVVLEPP